VTSVENRLRELEYQIAFERFRLDYVLAAQEGILREAESFHRARETRKYQAAFTAGNPLVSVCVSTANRPDLLVSRCLASLRQQTHQNLQVIVVGDHCVDDTAARVAALKDERISFHNLARRGPYPRPGRERWCVAGTYPANRALALCRGAFVTHLDDDDRFEPERIEVMVRAAQESRADLCWHPWWYERKDGSWYIRGNGEFESGQAGTDTVFYHHYLARIPGDVYSYRMGEPGDWNRLRKFAIMRARLHFVNRPLTHHYFGGSSQPFVPQPGERFLP
jgi:glycosyltransferase involved in cell wall biosynthesis